MNKLQRVIQELRLNVSGIHHVPESFSSEVYRVILQDRQTVYVKIPFNKRKLFRERTMLQRLASKLPVPSVLDYWEGDESIAGALVLSAMDGEPLVGDVHPTLAYTIGKWHAELHSVEMNGYGHDEFDGYTDVEHNDWRMYIQL